MSNKFFLPVSATAAAAHWVTCSLKASLLHRYAGGRCSLPDSDWLPASQEIRHGGQPPHCLQLHPKYHSLWVNLYRFEATTKCCVSISLSLLSDGVNFLSSWQSNCTAIQHWNLIEETEPPTTRIELLSINTVCGGGSRRWWWRFEIIQLIVYNYPNAQEYLSHSMKHSERIPIHPHINTHSWEMKFKVWPKINRMPA